MSDVSGLPAEASVDEGEALLAEAEQTPGAVPRTRRRRRRQRGRGPSPADLLPKLPVTRTDGYYLRPDGLTLRDALVTLPAAQQHQLDLYVGKGFMFVGKRARLQNGRFWVSEQIDITKIPLIGKALASRQAEGIEDLEDDIWELEQRLEKAQLRPEDRDNVMDKINTTTARLELVKSAFPADAIKTWAVGRRTDELMSQIDKVQRRMFEALASQIPGGTEAFLEALSAGVGEVADPTPSWIEQLESESPDMAVIAERAAAGEQSATVIR